MIVLPTNSLMPLRKFLIDHRDLVLRYMVKEITKAVDTNAEKAEFFRFGETNFWSGCKQPEYALVVEEALSYFVEHEMYEEAATCRDLIIRIRVDGIISSSAQPD